jgi:hypothetical protein
MSYREVDAAIVTRVCQDWLRAFNKDKDEYYAKEISKQWWAVAASQPTSSDRLMARKVKHSNRVYELLALSNCPCAMNRIMHLNAEDCWILFENYK